MRGPLISPWSTALANAGSSPPASLTVVNPSWRAMLTVLDGSKGVGHKIVVVAVRPGVHPHESEVNVGVN